MLSSAEVYGVKDESDPDRRYEWRAVDSCLLARLAAAVVEVMDSGVASSASSSEEKTIALSRRNGRVHPASTVLGVAKLVMSLPSVRSTRHGLTCYVLLRYVSPALALS